MAKIVIYQESQLVREVELHKERMTIGRHPQNDIVIEHGTVSGRHAVITLQGDGALLEDLGSTNGTFVNGKRIQQHRLGDRERAVLARFQIDFIAGPKRGPAAVARPATIAVRSGINAGKTLALSKPVTTLGSPGVLVVAIARRGGDYLLSHIDGQSAPRVNGKTVAGEVLLAHGDEIDLAGTLMAFSAST